MDGHLLNLLAVRVLKAWLLSLGYQPSSGWDENDINCRREYGPHVVWTVQATVPSDIDMDAVTASFHDYIDAHNSVVTAIKFKPYNLDLYTCRYVDGEVMTHLFASIYQ